MEEEEKEEIKGRTNRGGDERGDEKMGTVTERTRQLYATCNSGLNCRGGKEYSWKAIKIQLNYKRYVEIFCTDRLL